MKVTHFLIIRADRSVRVAKKTNRMQPDEVAVKIVLDFPDSWGNVIGEVSIDMPEFTPTVEYVAGDDE